jgi:hypothetical protein
MVKHAPAVFVRNASVLFNKVEQLVNGECIYPPLQLRLHLDRCGAMRNAE